MIELKNISYIVENVVEKNVILDDISCVFDDNCFVAITGHNGSGKSTLTKIIMGIIKPTSGKIFFNGKDITNLSITERANLGINYAFQQPVAFRGITVKELIDSVPPSSLSYPIIYQYYTPKSSYCKEKRKSFSPNL